MKIEIETKFDIGTERVKYLECNEEITGVIGAYEIMKDPCSKEWLIRYLFVLDPIHALKMIENKMASSYWLPAHVLEKVTE